MKRNFPSSNELPLALRSFTAEFGMGSGTGSSLKPPGRRRTEWKSGVGIQASGRMKPHMTLKQADLILHRYRFLTPESWRRKPDEH
jgi:hypothetical protein